MDDIKQQKIKLNKDERNNANNKNEINRLNTMLGVIDRIYQFLEYKFLPGEQPDELKLAEWVKVSKKRLDKIKNKVQNPKNNTLQARPNQKSLIKFDKSNKLLEDIEHSKITYEEALKSINNIRTDIRKIINKESLIPNQVEVINILFMVDEIFTGEIKSVKANNEGILEIFKESDEQPDNTEMPELEGEQSGQGQKILTPDEMHSRLPITLAQLKVGNNSRKTYK